MIPHESIALFQKEATFNYIRSFSLRPNCSPLRLRHYVRHRVIADTIGKDPAEIIYYLNDESGMEAEMIQADEVKNKPNLALIDIGGQGDDVFFFSNAPH